MYKHRVAQSKGMGKEDKESGISWFRRLSTQHASVFPRASPKRAFPPAIILRTVTLAANEDVALAVVGEGKAEEPHRSSFKVQCRACVEDLEYC